MFAQEELRELAGATAYDQSGQKVGTVSSIYWGKATQVPGWLTVKTGLFGMKETFVPLALAKIGGHQEVSLAANKDTITGAPKIDPDGELSETEEQQLFSYYGLDYSHYRSSTGLPETGGQPMTGNTGQASAGGDDAMTRAEERMRVRTAAEPAGRARLRKYVVTEQVQRTVPVGHEEARIEREPITEATADQAMAGPDISEAENEVTLHQERPVVEKETVPVERVCLAKETVHDEETVSGEVRKERIETEGDTGPQR